MYQLLRRNPAATATHCCSHDLLPCRFGRKKFILAAAALILLANVLQIAAAGRAMLFAGRLIMGLGQGFATFTVPL
jgi:predicted MFS family arabinose efflux permease